MTPALERVLFKLHEGKELTNEEQLLVRDHLSYGYGAWLAAREVPGICAQCWQPDHHPGDHEDLGDFEMFLLELYHDYTTEILPRSDFLKALRLVEAYVFRRTICAIPTNSLNKTFATFRRSLKKDRYLESIEATFLLLPSYRRFPMTMSFAGILWSATSTTCLGVATGYAASRTMAGKSAYLLTSTPSSTSCRRTKICPRSGARS